MVMIWFLIAVLACLTLLAIGIFGTVENDRGLVFVTSADGISDWGDILDMAGRKRGYGIRRANGSWGLHALDGTPLGERASHSFVHFPTGTRAPFGSRRHAPRATMSLASVARGRLRRHR
jgi:hypothetical protein